MLLLSLKSFLSRVKSNRPIIDKQQKIKTFLKQIQSLKNRKNLIKESCYKVKIFEIENVYNQLS
jgi:hypothetical protein